MSEKEHDPMSAVSWTLLGVVLDCLFFGHGVLLASFTPFAGGIETLGAATIAYAALNAVLLLAAWIRPTGAVTIAATLLALAYATFLLAAVLQLDVVPGFPWLAGVVLLMAFIAANWLSIRRVLTRNA